MLSPKTHENPGPSDALVEIQHLKVYFQNRPNLFGKKVTILAVDDVTLSLKQGEVFGLVGESGSGKSTLARAIVKLQNPTGGSIDYRGQNITKQDKRATKEFRRHVQMIFQDPYESLNPQADVFSAVSEPAIIHGLAPKNKAQRHAKVTELLERVGLDPHSKMNRFPHELSGGERQRVAIARALSLEPDLVIADEAVSMLDVSVRLGILELMMDIKKRFNLTYIFITHDLGVARYICTRIAVMYQGKIVEIAQPDELIEHPLHHYTGLLLASIPGSPMKIPDQPADSTSNITEPSKCCRFHSRCPAAQEKCRTVEPPLVEMRNQHFAACHYPIA
jgi:oligopeptide/dipeptide ABC transporter ATP-binding protein